MECKAKHLYGDMYNLCKRLDDGTITKEETIRLRIRHDTWMEIECPDGCKVGRCPFREPDEFWIEERGLVDLADYLYHLEQDDYEKRLDGQIRLVVKKRDAMNHVLPGHYGSNQ